jgi:uncharacterized cupredoxin-like copper-binding protein
MGDRSAERILRERLATGAIDPGEYEERLGVLRQGSRGPRGPRGPRRALPVAIVVVVLAASVAAAWAIVAGPAGRSGSSCAAPTLPGTVVDVTAADMGGGMMGMGGTMMRLIARPSVVPAGVVSFRVRNVGSVAHEMVVMPLPPGGAGTRIVGPGNVVDETGSLGEASATCGAGAGEGIAPGTVGWLTLELAPGRYELLCNEPGHYASGMFAQLDVR